MKAEGRRQRISSFILHPAAFTLPKPAFGALTLLAVTCLSYLGLDMARGVSFGQAPAQAASKSAAW